MSREALVLLVCCCDFRDGAERLIPSKSLRNAVIWAFPGLLCILRMCAPRRAAAVVRPRGHEKSADRRRRILISRLLIIRASVPRRKSPFPAYFKGFPAVSPLIPPYPAFLKYPVSPQSFPLVRRRTAYGERGQAASRRYTVGVNLPAVAPVLSRPRCKTPFPLPLRCSLFPRFLRRRAGTNLRCISSPNQLYRNSYRKSTIARKILWYLNKTGRGFQIYFWGTVC